jgi:hypothetical protein
MTEAARCICWFEDGLTELLNELNFPIKLENPLISRGFSFYCEEKHDE